MSGSNTCTPSSPSDCWIRVGGTPSPELSTQLESKVSVLRQREDFPPNHEEDIRKLVLSTASGEFVTSPDRLARLRRLCQIYGVRIRPETITSHRKIIGPVIVAVKKVLFRVVEGLLGKTIKHQRDFNAEVVALLTDLCNEAGASPLVGPRTFQVRQNATSATETSGEVTR
jgi:hypothetical protein